MHPNIHEFGEKLALKLPGDLKVVYFTNSGSEANDLAVTMAKLHTGAHDIINLRNSYHGGSPFAMEMTNLGNWKFPLHRNLGIHATVNPDVYRGPWGGANCRSSVAQTQRSCSCAEGQCQATSLYLDQLDDLLRHCTPGKIAGFFAETIQGVGGAVQLPKGYLKGAYDLIRAKGGVCISDEVQCGFGRLGTDYWGFQTQDVIPDIVTMAKGIGNGFPMGAVVTTPAIAKSLTGALHFNTFGGNPMSCAVGSAVVDVIDEEELQANCHTVGTLLLKELVKLRDDFEVVGDIRGKGLMTGLELVKDKASRAPLPPEEVFEIWDFIKDNGVLIGRGGLYGTCLRIKPPMCITEDDVLFATGVMRRALEAHKSNHS
ncbi:PREDICTED: alanine--glyoxylate aminotransferase 2, mitochondrial-like [Amphimedon queenslandica]|uniref:Alanine--glyoxylate aminotransferase 2, mitochondrial n=1 Tax=Amphimedon queenslandica TaxID=400682 RepID=A0A1X7VEH7_AMPQE|nr:PREDICTED: alanine--glyoxylate aminotransferase 2, mitochondrial-like [Amphimedon queenslandica]|eukprot:XP_019849338.1 PREDICTED: alanine--glyoxylate aminotransferase 2, mitochondrial-like [Amphimedon queenslandica]